MPVTAIYANVACRDLDRSEGWFAALFDRAPDARPMDGLVEWHHGGTAGFQLHRDPAKAGGGTLTLMVDDIDAEGARLTAAGLAVPEPEPGGGGRIAQLRDPDGNLVVLVGPA